MDLLNRIELITHAEQALARAHLTLDVAAIAELLHPDYLLIQPDGTFETKQDLLNSFHQSNRQWDQAEVAQLDVKIFGDMARVLGIWKAVGTNRGKPFDYQARFISIWIDEDGHWKNILYTSVVL